MILDEKMLRELTEGDLRSIINAGLAEHLYLDYKQDVYGERDGDRKEFLLDICQFANAEGGFVLIGVPETRQDGQPTGTPDRDAQLGIEVQNPESVLQSYDARVATCIHERLRIESHAIPVGGGRVVLAFRIPNSTSKPHCVKYQGEHVYFPMRRERHRVYLDVREVKEMAMKAASQIERAGNLLKSTLSIHPAVPGQISLYIGLLPVFFRDFLIDVRGGRIREAFAAFHVRTRLPNYRQPTYGFNGLIRATERDTVTLGRNGLLRSCSDITHEEREGRLYFMPIAADLLLRNFIVRAQTFVQATEQTGAYILKIVLAAACPVVAMRAGEAGGLVELGEFPAGFQEYPEMQIQNILDPFEQIIRPLCDHVHQTFGLQGSPSFNAEGRWTAQY